MPLIIDTNVFHKTLTSSQLGPSQFIKVHEWLKSPKARIAYGGSKYQTELWNVRKYLDFFVEMEKSRKLIKLDPEKVDTLASELLRVVNDNDFDDEHILAISILSQAYAICTKDDRFVKHLKKKPLFPPNYSKPKIIKDTTPLNSVDKILCKCV